MAQVPPEERQRYYDHNKVRWSPRKQVMALAVTSDAMLVEDLVQHMRYTFLMNTFLQSEAATLDELTDVFKRQARDAEDEVYRRLLTIDLLVVPNVEAGNMVLTDKWGGSLATFLRSRIQHKRMTVFLGVCPEMQSVFVPGKTLEPGTIRGESLSYLQLQDAFKGSPIASTAFAYQVASGHTFFSYPFDRF